MLSRDELRELWAALHETEEEGGRTRKPRLSQTLNEAFLVMLLTARRCGEVCKMQWRDVNLDTSWWLIPGTVSKNHDPHRVPLTAMVLDILRRRARAQSPDDRYVFSNHRQTCVAARAKKAAAILCKGGVAFISARMISAAPLPRTWAKRALIGSTSPTCSITGV